jgi:hypothetical protein
MITEEHTSLPLFQVERTNEESVGNGNVCRAEGWLDLPQSITGKNIAALDGHDFPLSNGLHGKKPSPMDRTCLYSDFGRKIGKVGHKSPEESGRTHLTRR